MQGFLTLKTKGSEAVARGQDLASLESTKDKLAREALELAQLFGSTVTRVIDARHRQKFCGEGLLSLFAKANAEIKQPAQKVRRFSILQKIFSVKTGELLPNGNPNRIAIKKAKKNIISGRYQQKSQGSPKT